ncbi:hypothetical protein [Aeoliella sp. SH292]|uniref:hypothetical protein n=1 Tax=Aeoliella sp. SH292 TaxID=3454464 RepID=UPI003F989994
MDQPADSSLASPWRHRFAFVVAAVVSGSVIGLGAALVQSRGVFLVGLQSLAAGAMLSVLLVGTSALLTSRKPRWPVALLAGVVAVLVQHVWLYRFALAGRRDAVAKKPAVEFFRPGWSEQSIWSYFAEEATAQALLMWTLDAVLLVGAAVVIVELASKKRTPLES